MGLGGSSRAVADDPEAPGVMQKGVTEGGLPAGSEAGQADRGGQGQEVGNRGWERVVTFKEQQAAAARDGSIPTEQPRSAGASAPTSSLTSGRVSRLFPCHLLSTWCSCLQLASQSSESCLLLIRRSSSPIGTSGSCHDASCAVHKT